MPGWKSSTVGLTKYSELPENARAYLKKMEELMEVPVDIISTGPDRARLSCSSTLSTERKI